MELLILAIILIGLAFLSLSFGYDSRAAAYSKELEQARLGIVWELEVLRVADSRRDAELWRAQRGVHSGARRASRGMRRRVAGGLRALARRLSPELATPHMLDMPQQQVAGC